MIPTRHAWRPAEEERSDIALLIENIDLLLAAREEIVSRPELCHCEPRGCGIGALYAGPNGPLPLGMMLTLWSRGEWIETCDRCAGDVYVTYAAGSPFSGRGSWSGFCPTCAVDPACETWRQSASIGTGFGLFIRPVLELRDDFANPLLPHPPAPKWRWDRPPERSKDVVVPKVGERVYDGERLEVVVGYIERSR